MKDPFHDNYVDTISKRVIWSNPYGDINSTRTVRERDRFTILITRYDEMTGTRYGSHACPIGEVSKPGEYRFTDKCFYQTNGYNNRQQNELNLFAPDGDLTMITKDRAGLDDRGIIEPASQWNRYGKTAYAPWWRPVFVARAYILHTYTHPQIMEAKGESRRVSMR